LLKERRVKGMAVHYTGRKKAEMISPFLYFSALESGLMKRWSCNTFASPLNKK
jgi:hypothetical protein